MYDFLNFTAVDSMKCGQAMRRMGANAKSMEETANEIVRFFFESFVEAQTGQQSCVLVRLFKTHDYNQLEDDLKAFVRDLQTHEGLPDNFKCFTLLATCGIDADWQSRKTSKGHQAIPLPSTQIVEKIPMMRNMVKQMGLEISHVVRPDPKIIMDLSQRTFNVFHVPQVEGSPYVPAQAEFVKPYGVKSVLGFGGVLPSGNMFTVIIFSRTPIASEVANLFSTVALNVKMALLPFLNAVFTSSCGR